MLCLAHESRSGILDAFVITHHSDSILVARDSLHIPCPAQRRYESNARLPEAILIKSLAMSCCGIRNLSTSKC